MKIGDRIYVHGYVDEIRKDCVIIHNDGGYFGTVKSEIVEAQKAEDIVSVIRCKDCKHSLHNQFTGDWYCWLYNIARKVESDGFCYKAERNDND